MSRLNQIQVTFVAEEDRLLLRINTTDLAEFRFWLTRRMIGMLWPAIIQTLSSDPQVAIQADKSAKEAVLAFQKEKAATNADFKTPYQEQPNQLPLGEQPILVTKIQIKAGQGNMRALCLHPSSGNGIEIAVDTQTLHTLCILLQNKAQVAQWGLTLNLGEVPSVTQPLTPANVN